MNIHMSSTKQMLEGFVCPEHKERPTVTIELGNIEIKACCEPFRAGLEQIANQEYVRAIDAAVVDVLDQRS